MVADDDDAPSIENANDDTKRRTLPSLAHGLVADSYEAKAGNISILVLGLAMNERDSRGLPFTCL